MQFNLPNTPASKNLTSNVPPLGLVNKNTTFEKVKVASASQQSRKSDDEGNGGGSEKPVWNSGSSKQLMGIQDVGRPDTAVGGNRELGILGGVSFGKTVGTQELEKVKEEDFVENPEVLGVVKASAGAAHRFPASQSKSQETQASVSRTGIQEQNKEKEGELIQSSKQPKKSSVNSNRKYLPQSTFSQTDILHHPQLALASFRSILKLFLKVN